MIAKLKNASRFERVILALSVLAGLAYVAILAGLL